jgi:excisionase family DNA binding protein
MGIATVAGDRLLTAEELAERWQVSVDQVYRLAKAGRAPAVKLGRYYRFRLDAVEQFERNGGSGLLDIARSRA